MVDLVALGIVLLVVVAVTLRKTSAGIGVMGLLAGVLLDQLLSDWLINLLPEQLRASSQYIPVAVRLLITFTPVIASLIAVKVSKHNLVLSLLTSLVLGFLVVFFGLKIVAPLPMVTEAAKNSGLLTFLSPYQNVILSGSAVLALAEMILSHHRKRPDYKKK